MHANLIFNFSTQTHFYVSRYTKNLRGYILLEPSMANIECNNKDMFRHLYPSGWPLYFCKHFLSLNIRCHSTTNDFQFPLCTDLVSVFTWN